MSSKSEKSWGAELGSPDFFDHLDDVLKDSSRGARITAAMELSAIDFLLAEGQVSSGEFVTAFGLLGVPLLAHLERVELAAVVGDIVTLTHRCRHPTHQ